MSLWSYVKKPTFADGEPGEQNSDMDRHGWVDHHSEGGAKEEILVCIRDFYDKREDYLDSLVGNLEEENGHDFLLEDSTEAYPGFILLE